jgi:hypothetical protein
VLCEAAHASGPFLFSGSVHLHEPAASERDENALRVEPTRCIGLADHGSPCAIEIDERVPIVFCERDAQIVTLHS